MLNQLKYFFAQPGINKSGFCAEAGITMQYLNRVLNEVQPLTESLIEKLMPVLKKYGFEAAHTQTKKKGK